MSEKTTRRTKPTLTLRPDSDPEAEAKTLIHQLVAENGGRIEGKLKLYKAFWMASLSYMKETGRQLTSWQIVKMPDGPGIHDAKRLIFELFEEGRVKPTIGIGVLQNKWVLESMCPAPEPDEALLRAIRIGLEYAGALSERELSADSHRNAWYEAANGREMELSLDLLNEEEFLEAKRSGRKNARDLEAVFLGTEG